MKQTLLRLSALAIGSLNASMIVGAIHGAWRTPEDRVGAAVREAALHMPLSVAVTALLAPVVLGLSDTRREQIRSWYDDSDRKPWVHAVLGVFPVACVLWLAGGARMGGVFMTAFHHVGLAAMAQSVALLLFTLVMLVLSLVAIRALAVRAALTGTKAFVMGIGAAVAVVGVGLATGDVHGRGGLFGAFAVLRKPELELAPVWVLLGTLVLASVLCVGLHKSAKRQLVFVLSGCLALTFSMRETMLRYERSPAGAVIENRAGLARVVLRALRKRTDRDHDHVSAYFGGGDCDDRDPRRSPEARDIPGNGVDEDCSGADAVVVARRPTTAAVVPLAQRPRVPPKNIILITVDTLRWDLHYAGNPRPLSPNLDALAARSVVMDHGYALSSYTARSIGPLMAGRFPTELPRDRAHFVHYPDRGNTFLAERLRTAGFHTAAVASHFYFERRYGNMQGIEQLDMSAERNGEIIEAESTDARVADRAIAMLQNTALSDGRFFLWVHFFDPHKQYVLHPEIPPFARNERGKYDAEVAWTDRQIGRVLTTLSQQSFAEQTMVVMTADHGEAFAEHGLSYHGVELWEELVRVPWMFAVPGVAPRHIAMARSHIDLVPTVLDTLGLPLPTTDAQDFVSGESLLGELLGTVTPATRSIYCELPEGPFNGTRRALIDGAYKLLYRGGRQFELYNLEGDPGEHHNAAATEPAELLSMRNRMEQFRSTLREVEDHE